MEQTIIRVGNSVGVILPKTVRDQVGFKPGDKVFVEPDRNGHSLVLHKKGKGIKPITITPEFYNWLEGFNKRYGKALQELARK